MDFLLGLLVINIGLLLCGGGIGAALMHKHHLDVNAARAQEYARYRRYADGERRYQRDRIIALSTTVRQYEEERSNAASWADGVEQGMMIRQSETPAGNVFRQAGNGLQGAMVIRRACGAGKY